jgi:hypothetical protein
MGASQELHPLATHLQTSASACIQWLLATQMENPRNASGVIAIALTPAVRCVANSVVFLSQLIARHNRLVWTPLVLCHPTLCIWTMNKARATYLKPLR